MSDSNSGTVCKCEHPVHQVHPFEHLCNNCGRVIEREPAPAEQPRQKPFSQLRGELMSLGDAHMLNKGVPYKSVSPVAASPAEGTLRNMTNEQLVSVAMAVTETETRALYRAELLRRMSTTQPSAKVEEIAHQIAQHIWIHYRPSKEEIEADQLAIAVILRPYFPANAPRPETPKSCDFPFTESCTQFESCIRANRCLKNLPESERVKP